VFAKWTRKALYRSHIYQSICLSACDLVLAGNLFYRYVFKLNIGKCEIWRATQTQWPTVQVRLLGASRHKLPTHTIGIEIQGLSRDVSRIFLFILILTKISLVCFLLGDSPASEFYMPTFRNTLSAPFPSQPFSAYSTPNMSPA